MSGQKETEMETETERKTENVKPKLKMKVNVKTKHGYYLEPIRPFPTPYVEIELPYDIGSAVDLALYVTSTVHGEPNIGYLDTNWIDTRIRQFTEHLFDIDSTLELAYYGNGDKIEMAVTVTDRYIADNETMRLIWIREKRNEHGIYDNHIEVHYMYPDGPRLEYARDFADFEPKRVTDMHVMVFIRRLMHVIYLALQVFKWIGIAEDMVVKAFGEDLVIRVDVSDLPFEVNK